MEVPRIVVDVTHGVDVVAIGSYKAVEDFALPKASRASHLLIDFQRAEAFYAPHDVGNVPSGIEFEEEVYVVGHDDIGVDVAGAAVVVGDGLLEDVAERGLAEEAGAVAGVEGFHEVGTEGAEVGFVLFYAVGHMVEAFEVGVDDLRRKGVGKPEGEGVDFSALTFVGQMAVCVAGVGLFVTPRVVGAEGGHGIVGFLRFCFVDYCVERDVLKTSPPWMAHGSRKGF